VAYLIPLMHVHAQLFAAEQEETPRAASWPTKEPSTAEAQAAGMMRRVSATACALMCAAIVFAPLSARADVSEANALSAGLLAPANASLQSALRDIKDNQKAAAAAND